MTDNGKTHYDPVEAGAICHDACAIAEIERLRDERQALHDALTEATGQRDQYRNDLDDMHRHIDALEDERDDLRAIMAGVRAMLDPEDDDDDAELVEELLRPNLAPAALELPKGLKARHGDQCSLRYGQDKCNCGVLDELTDAKEGRRWPGRAYHGDRA